MPNIIDKITFEVESNPSLGDYRYVILSYKDILLARVLCNIKHHKLKGLYYASINEIHYDKAPYLSLDRYAIYSLTKNFILGGGLGVDIKYLT